MSKSKKTPEQEKDTQGKAPATPESDKDPPAKETPQDGQSEEKPAEQNAEDKGDSEDKPSEVDQEDAEDSQEDEDKPEDDKADGEPSEEEHEDTPDAPLGAKASNTEEQLQTDLLDARCKLAAYGEGVDSSKIGDAVILATAEARKEGDLTETGIAKAMANVLKRHPEWKASSGDSKKPGTGGFKLGADPDKTGSGKKSGSKTTGNTKRWNRYK